MEDKRRFMRFGVNMRVELSYGPGAGSTIRGDIVDYSRGGIKVILPRSLPYFSDMFLRLKAYLPNQHIPIIFDGNLKWMNERDRMYEAGIETDKISSCDNCDVLDYAYNRWRRSLNV